MKNVIRRVDLDLSRRTNKRFIFANQYDYDSRTFIISLYEDGARYLVDKEVTAFVNIKRSDGETWSYVAEVTDEGNIRFVATLWTFEVAGETQFTVSLYDGQRRITSSQFVVNVLPDFVSSTDIDDVAENLGLFQQAMDYFAEINKDEQNRRKNETARQEAEIARENGEFDRTSAELTRIDNENARCKNEEERDKITETMIIALDNLLLLQKSYIDRAWEER